MGTVTPCSWRQKSDCALRSLTSTERTGLVCDGLARQERVVRKGVQRGEAGSRETDWGGSRGSQQQARKVVPGARLAARMTAKVDACGCTLQAGGKAGN